MPFVAGNEIQAFCPDCGTDSANTVIEVHGGLVLKVRCMTCKVENRYHRPHGPPLPEKKAKTPRRAATKTTKRTKRGDPPGPPPEWVERAMGKQDEDFRVYSMKESYRLHELVGHPKFGTGVVTEVRPEGKIEIAFREGRKILVHSRA
jgi:hypothetical protein